MYLDGPVPHAGLLGPWQEDFDALQDNMHRCGHPPPRTALPPRWRGAATSPRLVCVCARFALVLRYNIFREPGAVVAFSEGLSQWTWFASACGSVMFLCKCMF